MEQEDGDAGTKLRHLRRQADDHLRGVKSTIDQHVNSVGERIAPYDEPLGRHVGKAGGEMRNAVSAQTENLGDAFDTVIRDLETVVSDHQNGGPGDDDPTGSGHAVKPSGEAGGDRAYSGARLVGVCNKADRPFAADWTRLSGYNRLDVRTALQSLLESVEPGDEPDTYAAGGVVKEVENLVVEVAGQPGQAALFFPTGVMAQQAALKAHEARGQGSRVGLHPTSHLMTSEANAIQRVSGLEPVLIGDPRRTILPEHLSDAAGPPRIVLLELPQRETGGHLPTQDDLAEMAQWARRNDAVLHLDGARLWEAALALDVHPKEITKYFDSVYVSFYKALGHAGNTWTPAGAALLGDSDFIQEAYDWRTGMGGRPAAMWPYALPVRNDLRDFDAVTLPRLTSWHERAAVVASAISDEPGLSLAADKPSILMHVLFESPDARDDPRQRLAEATYRTAVDTGVLVSNAIYPGPSDRTAGLELNFYEASENFTTDDVMSLLRRIRDTVVDADGGRQTSG